MQGATTIAANVKALTQSSTLISSEMTQKCGNKCGMNQRHFAAGGSA
jgi:hypothetical protein